MILNCKTRSGDNNIHGQAKIVFIATEKDRVEYLEEIWSDISKHVNVALFYVENYSESDEQEMLECLEEMQMAIVPVTADLFYSENPAKGPWISKVKELNVPILPIMCEAGILEEYGELFGELQFMDKYEYYEKSKGTQISYEDKLKARLTQILIGDELAKKVQAAFEEYVFLSYRKMDRKQAKQLMKMIHSHKKCEDFAIWYDEFLVPGESFEQGIQNALKQSKAFVLCVTENILDEGNYVLETEYPQAIRNKDNVPVILIQMSETDMERLSVLYSDGISEDFISLDDEDRERKIPEKLVEALNRVAAYVDNDSAEHEYYVGLAYLYGINMEMDAEHGLALLERSAESGYIPAMKQLAKMYEEGIFVTSDLIKATEYQTAIVKKLEEKISEKSSIDVYEELFEETQVLMSYYSYDSNFDGQADIYKHFVEVLWRFECTSAEEKTNRAILDLRLVASIRIPKGNHNTYIRALRSLRSEQSKINKEVFDTKNKEMILRYIGAALDYYDHAEMTGDYAGYWTIINSFLENNGLDELSDGEKISFGLRLMSQQNRNKEGLSSNSSQRMSEIDTPRDFYEKMLKVDFLYDMFEEVYDLCKKQYENRPDDINSLRDMAEAAFAMAIFTIKGSEITENNMSDFGKNPSMDYSEGTNEDEIKKKLIEYYNSYNYIYDEYKIYFREALDIEYRIVEDSRLVSDIAVMSEYIHELLNAHSTSFAMMDEYFTVDRAYIEDYNEKLIRIAIEVYKETESQETLDIFKEAIANCADLEKVNEYYSLIVDVLSENNNSSIGMQKQFAEISIEYATRVFGKYHLNITEYNGNEIAVIKSALDSYKEAMAIYKANIDNGLHIISEGEYEYRLTREKEYEIIVSFYEELQKDPKKYAEISEIGRLSNEFRLKNALEIEKLCEETNPESDKHLEAIKNVMGCIERCYDDSIDDYDKKISLLGLHDVYAKKAGTFDSIQKVSENAYFYYTRLSDARKGEYPQKLIDLLNDKAIDAYEKIISECQKDIYSPGNLKEFRHSCGILSDLYKEDGNGEKAIECIRMKIDSYDSAETEGIALAASKMDFAAVLVKRGWGADAEFIIEYCDEHGLPETKEDLIKSMRDKGMIE